MERRAWIQTAGNKLYPNLYILLVGPPGVGKDQAIKPATEFAVKADLRLAPAALSHKGFIDHLADSSTAKVLGEADVIHTMYAAVPELGVILSEYDKAFLSSLNKLYDCPPTHDERIRGREGVLHINQPVLNIIAGSQPKYLELLLPEAAFGMGFTSRMIMIYHGTPTKQSLFAPYLSPQEHVDELTNDIIRIAHLKGPIQGMFELTTRAVEQIEHWHQNQSSEDAPTHSKLTNYIPRRIMHLLKLCMVKSVSRGDSMEIDVPDFEWALATLREAEELMPQIFREMKSGGNMSWLAEAYDYVRRVYNSKGGRPVPESMLSNWLSSYAPATQVAQVIDLMIKNEMIEEKGVGKVLPGAYHSRAFVPKEWKMIEEGTPRRHRGLTDPLDHAKD